MLVTSIVFVGIFTDFFQRRRVNPTSIKVNNSRQMMKGLGAHVSVRCWRQAIDANGSVWPFSTNVTCFWVVIPVFCVHKKFTKKFTNSSWIWFTKSSANPCELRFTKVSWVHKKVRRRASLFKFGSRVCQVMNLAETSSLFSKSLFFPVTAFYCW